MRSELEKLVAKWRNSNSGAEWCDADRRVHQCAGELAVVLRAHADKPAVTTPTREEIAAGLSTAYQASELNDDEELEFDDIPEDERRRHLWMADYVLSLLRQAPSAQPECSVRDLSDKSAVPGFTVESVTNLLYNYLSDSDLPDELVPDAFLMPWAKAHAPELHAQLVARAQRPAAAPVEWTPSLAKRFAAALCREDMARTAYEWGASEFGKHAPVAGAVSASAREKLAQTEALDYQKRWQAAEAEVSRLKQELAEAQRQFDELCNQREKDVGELLDERDALQQKLDASESDARDLRVRLERAVQGNGELQQKLDALVEACTWPYDGYTLDYAIGCCHEASLLHLERFLMGIRDRVQTALKAQPGEVKAVDRFVHEPGCMQPDAHDCACPSPAVEREKAVEPKPGDQLKQRSEQIAAATKRDLEATRVVLGPSEDTVKREPGCECQWEAGDSPCRVHGDEEHPEPKPGDVLDGPAAKDGACAGHRQVDTRLFDYPDVLRGRLAKNPPNNIGLEAAVISIAAELDALLNPPPNPAKPADPVAELEGRVRRCEAAIRKLCSDGGILVAGRAEALAALEGKS